MTVSMWRATCSYAHLARHVLDTAEQRDAAPVQLGQHPVGIGVGDRLGV
jgi:hypothetical protein